MIEYKDVGVDYDKLDGFKRLCQQYGLETAKNIIGSGAEEESWSRGESVHLVYLKSGMGGVYLGHLNEGLGTKNLVADLYGTGENTCYDKIAYDTASSAFNDAITLGVRPLSACMHLAVADGSWFDNAKRNLDLTRGFKEACDDGMCVWGGGETPALSGIVVPGTAMLACSVMGKVEHKVMNPNFIEKGDRIIFFEGNGLHINGYSLARKIATILSDGYNTLISDGRPYGDALLDKTPIYTKVIMEILKNYCEARYGINVSGHGFRKIMRHTKPFEYVIEKLPNDIAPIFEFIQRIGGYDDNFMYETFNMGVGFVLIVKKSSVDDVLKIAVKMGFSAFDAGYVKSTSKEKRVIIEPKNLIYDGSSLQVR